MDQGTEQVPPSREQSWAAGQAQPPVTPPPAPPPPRKRGGMLKGCLIVLVVGGALGFLAVLAFVVLATAAFVAYRCYFDYGTLFRVP